VNTPGARPNLAERSDNVKSYATGDSLILQRFRDADVGLRVVWVTRRKLSAAARNERGEQLYHVEHLVALRDKVGPQPSR
jgi:hypothetical protein